jgi:hypothetical protein
MVRGPIPVPSAAPPAVVDVQQRALRTFEQDRAFCLLRAADFEPHVARNSEEARRNARQ